MKVAKGRWFDELAVGETFGSTVTITEAHVMLGAGFVADFNPLHVDEEFARKSRFGGRILHGMLTSAMMGGPVGMHFHGTAIAYLEHNARFVAPVRPGDTLTIEWSVTRLVPKPAHGGGIVDMTGDRSPIISMTDVEGLYVNCGWGTGGFKAIPGSGFVFADTIANGRPHPIAEPFSLNRFAEGRLIDESVAAAVAH